MIAGCPPIILEGKLLQDSPAGMRILCNLQVLRMARQSESTPATELLEAVLSVDLAHPNIVQTYLTSTREARRVRLQSFQTIIALAVMHPPLHPPSPI